MLLENVFVGVVALEPFEVWKKVRSGSLKGAMLFFREFQESLAEYAKHHPYDKIQRAALEIQHFLEKKIRAEYFDVKRKSMMRSGMILPEKIMKTRIKADWGKFYKTLAY
jgi:hypothetical protein